MTAVYASETVAHDTLTTGSHHGAIFVAGGYRPEDIVWSCAHHHRTARTATGCAERELRRRDREETDA